MKKIYIKPPSFACRLTRGRTGCKIINFSETAAIVRPNTHGKMGLDGEGWDASRSQLTSLEHFPRPPARDGKKRKKIKKRKN